MFENAITNISAVDMWSAWHVLGGVVLGIAIRHYAPTDKIPRAPCCIILILTIIFYTTIIIRGTKNPLSF